METKNCSDGPGYINNMALCKKIVKIFKIFSSGTNKPMVLKLDM